MLFYRAELPLSGKTLTFVAQIITAANAHDIQALPVWYHDSMIVIGDAAHAAYPTTAQSSTITSTGTRLPALPATQRLRSRRSVPKRKSDPVTYAARILGDLRESAPGRLRRNQLGENATHQHIDGSLWWIAWTALPRN